MFVARRAVAVSRPLLSRSGSSAVGPWGPMNFAGSNWVGKGALPFGFQSRTVWYIGFYTTCAALFSIPFVNLEINVNAARADARKKQEELKEQIRAESPSVKW